MNRALERHESGEARVIPIILRPVSWYHAPFNKLQVLPRDGIPINSSHWFSRDEAWIHVIEELQKVIASFWGALPIAQGTPVPRVWYLPHRRNPFFTGRDTVITQLYQRLHTAKLAALTQIQAISGLGGIGKTQIALEYAYRYRQEYRAVFWINASTTETMLADMISIVRILGLFMGQEQSQKTIGAIFTTWLKQHRDWLLILDDASDLTLVDRTFSPHVVSQGHVIITTRSQTTGSLAVPVIVGKMKKEEGAVLLLRRAGILTPDAVLNQIVPKAKSEAAAIVQVLDGLPLAIDQAGAYIEETGCSLAGYLDLYKKRRKELLAWRGRFPPGHPDPVAATWDLSFRQVERTNPAAADLLRLCAMLDTDTIPEAILNQGAAELGPHLAPVAADTFFLNRAIEILRTFSLIQRDPATKSLSVHRLVQVVIQDAMDENLVRIWAERAIKAVDRTFPSAEKIGTSPLIVQPYLPHAQACAVHIRHYDFAFPEAASLLNKVAYALNILGQYRQAEPLYQRALAIRERIVGANHPDTAMIISSLAGLYRKQGKYEQAEPLFRRALAIYERVLGTEHPYIAASFNNLAGLYHEQGKYEQAEPLFRRALAIYERVLGTEHPHTATSLNNLAGLYRKQGKHEQAEPLYQRALKIRKQVLGAQHPNTATSLNNLAVFYREQGKYQQAEPLYQRALKIREQVLGAQHPDTATSLNNLAVFYHKQGKYEQAEPLYQRALDIYETVLGAQHPDTATSLNNLAIFYREQGEYEQAEPLYQRALAIYETVFGLNHPYVANSLIGYAYLLHKLGRSEEAKILRMRAQAIQARYTSSKHNQ